jgi:hypothetical protein
MDWRRMPAASSLIAELPPLPRPWSVDVLCERLEAQRRRPLVLHALSLPAVPFGLCYRDGECDHIIHRAEFTGYYRDHVILHELCHLLADHGTSADPRRGAGPAEQPLSSLVARAQRNPHSPAEEELAEVFATQVLKSAQQTPPVPVSGFERRAAAMFGVD